MKCLSIREGSSKWPAPRCATFCNSVSTSKVTNQAKPGTGTTWKRDRYRLQCRSLHLGMTHRSETGPPWALETRGSRTPARTANAPPVASCPSWCILVHLVHGCRKEGAHGVIYQRGSAVVIHLSSIICFQSLSGSLLLAFCPFAAPLFLAHREHPSTGALFPCIYRVLSRLKGRP